MLGKGSRKKKEGRHRRDKEREMIKDSASHVMLYFFCLTFFPGCAGNDALGRRDGMSCLTWIWIRMEIFSGSFLAGTL